MTDLVERQCTCLEVHGENPNCTLHGEGTTWALENTLPSEWQERNVELAEEKAALARSLKATAEAAAEHLQTVTALRTENEALRKRVAEVEGVIIMAASWFDDYALHHSNEAWKAVGDLQQSLRLERMRKDKAKAAELRAALSQPTSLQKAQETPAQPNGGSNADA